MICRNGEQEGDGKRRFTRITRAARPAFRAIAADDAAHIARGLLTNACSRAFIAELSYDCSTGLTSILVRLPCTKGLSDRELLSVARLQRTSLLARIDYDEEDRFLIARTSAVCPVRSGASDMLNLMVEDLVRLLDDDRLGALIDSRDPVATHSTPERP